MYLHLLDLDFEMNDWRKYGMSMLADNLPEYHSADIALNRTHKNFKT